MASVTFPVPIGGDGTTVSDDNNPTTGLGANGHRTRFIIAMQNLVAIATAVVTNGAAAVAAAATAINAPGTQATSVTSMSIGSGVKSFTLAETGKAFGLGQTVAIADAAAPGTNAMYGAISAFNSGTGVIEVTVPTGSFIGTGTKTSWVITVTGAKGADAALTYATAAEINAATDLTKTINTDELAKANIAKRIIQVQITDPGGSAITTGDGKGYVLITSELNGFNLIGAIAAVSTNSSSGIPTFQLRRNRSGADVDMLSTKLTIDANEPTSLTAANALVINASNDDVATGDRIFFDFDVAGTGTKGVNIVMIFQLP